MTEEHKQKIGGLSRTFYSRLFVILAVAALLAAAYNFAETRVVLNMVNDKIAELKEEQRSANVQLIVLSPESCESCFDENLLVDMIKATGVSVAETEKVSYPSERAALLIAEQGIEKLPAVIVKGELEKAKALAAKAKEKGKATNEAYVFEAEKPLYVDAVTGKIAGELSVSIIKNSECLQCTDLGKFVDSLGLAGVVVKDRKEIDMKSEEGIRFISLYNLEKLPAVVFNSEAGAYPELVQLVEAVGSIEQDGSYVVRSANLPYYDLNTSKIVGLVQMDVLSDSSCSECYDAKALHLQVLKRMGVEVSEINNIDISREQGREAVAKYNITKVPAMVLRGDVSAYPELVKAWADVGTVEKDGSYVFRLVEFAEPYKDLLLGKVVSKSAPSAATGSAVAGDMSDHHG